MIQQRKSAMAKVCILGLGYIGLPTASLLSIKGFRVAGVDVDARLVHSLQQGKCAIYEPALDVLVKSALQSGHLTVSDSPSEADVFIICVPTPFKAGHKPDLSYVDGAVAGIAPLLRCGNLVILESTAPVGTTERMAALLAEMRPDLRIGQKAPGNSEPVHVAHCPERVLPGRMVVGFIGSFTAYEGLESLMDAVLELNWRGFPVSLLLVGDGADTLKRLKNLHQARGGHPAIIFTGRVPFAEVKRYYSLIDIMPFPRIPAKVCQCVPPLKPLEAMAMEKAVLVSNVAALTEIVRDGETGLVFESGNLPDLVEKLEALITMPDLRHKLAQKGRAWVLAERDWARVSERILRVYERLLEK